MSHHYDCSQSRPVAPTELTEMLPSPMRPVANGCDDNDNGHAGNRAALTAKHVEVAVTGGDITYVEREKEFSTS